MLARVALLVLLGLFADLARAGETRVALVIGNSAYASAGRLDNPVRDAASVAKALRETGFQTVRLERDLDRDGMIEALRAFETLADGADWALIYFAGHGLEVGGENYLVPVDARLRSDRDVSEEASSLDQVLKRVEGAHKLRVVILDACRNNPFVANMKRTLTERSVGSGLAPLEVRQVGTLVAYAAAAKQTASDGENGQGNSPFAAALVKHLATPDLEVNLLFRRVRAEVLKATGRRQEPATYESLPDERFVFKPAAPVQHAALPPPAPRPSAPVATPPSPTPAALPSPGYAPPRPPLLSRAQLFTACDRLAASPTDPDRPPHVKGLFLKAIDTESALTVCRSAAELTPPERRMLFQYGRALYAAERFGDARRSYEAAASLGSSSAMNGLGVLHADGKGIPRDYAEARKWYERGARLGDPLAISNIGNLYDTGRGVPQDYARAFEHYARAAELGNAIAMVNLGVLYATGRGVRQDYAQARAWYERAAALGETSGMRGLGFLFANGRGVAVDLVKARFWLQKAAALGDSEAGSRLERLARMRR